MGLEPITLRLEVLRAVQLRQQAGCKMWGLNPRVRNAQSILSRPLGPLGQSCFFEDTNTIKIFILFQVALLGSNPTLRLTVARSQPTESPKLNSLLKIILLNNIFINTFFFAVRRLNT